MGWMEALRGVGWKHRRVYGQVRCGVRTPWFYRLGLACLTRRVASRQKAAQAWVGGCGRWAGLDRSELLGWTYRAAVPVIRETVVRCGVPMRFLGWVRPWWSAQWRAPLVVSLGDVNYKI
jgi:hypothetical protein